MLRIAVLASGRGSNLRALAEAIARGELDARIVGVFSDKADSGAIRFAHDTHLPATTLRPRDFTDRAAYDQALFAAVDASGAELIVCAGFMRILSAEAVAPRTNRLINIHPSLLPKYPGLHTHERAIAAHDAEHGASVHVVIPALDAGPVIARTILAIQPDDTPETLAARLLPQEHRLLVQTVRWIADGRLALSPDAVLFDGQRLSVPLRVD